LFIIAFTAAIRNGTTAISMLFKSLVEHAVCARPGSSGRQGYRENRLRISVPPIPEWPRLSRKQMSSLTVDLPCLSRLSLI